MLMTPEDLARRLAAEALGTAFLLATVIGSGQVATASTGPNASFVKRASSIQSVSPGATAN